MPQPRKYESRAAQQSAYRKRQLCSQHDLLSRKGLPALPAISTIPGQSRWRAMVEQAQILLSEAVDEMESYHDDRSEQWQESSRADDLRAKLEALQEIVEQLQGID